MNSLQRKIRMAIDSELPDAAPSGDLRNKVVSTLPGRVPQAGGAVRRYLPAALMAAVLLVSATGVVLAATPQGRAAVDWAFERFGIHLVAATPEVRADLVAQGAEVTSGVEVPYEGLASKLPTGMKLPAYLPAEITKDPVVNLNTWSSGASVSMIAKHGGPHVTIMYHSSAFSRNSMIGTEGNARDVQEVKVGAKSGMAYRDDNGWNVWWALNGHQYTVMTDLPLEEALKVAESIK